MKNEITKEVQDALTANSEEITFEQVLAEDTSPLNLPVVEKDIGGERVEDSSENKSWNVWKPESSSKNVEDLHEKQSEVQADFRTSTEAQIAQEKAQQPLDAPEQKIDSSSEDSTINELPEQTFQIPIAQANQAADALLGMTNNMLEVGGGYFVKLKKHEEFYDFDEIIKLVDEQNTKNFQRIKLDKEDQALLRPLLAQVLQKKSKKLTPEQQLMGAIVSILMKKAQTVMEVRAENSLLEARILQIIKEEKKDTENTHVNNEDIDNSSIVTSTEQADTKHDFEEAVDAESSILEVAETIKTAS